MRRPVIGVTSSIEQARWGSWGTLVLLSPRNYSLAVQRAGALAVLLSIDDDVAQDPAQLLDMLDGLLLSGGADINPDCYGAAVGPETWPGRPERDRFELALARAALERDMPVLGICRGMELLNVALGGTLVQHLPNLELHRPTPGEFHEHEVVLEPGSLAARAAGGERFAVSSHHHQGVERLGEGLSVSGHAAEDDLIEAIELPEKSFALGVLWHPEQQEESGVVAALVDTARERAAP
jgi:putative glutamine amidotransferase